MSNGTTNLEFNWKNFQVGQTVYSGTLTAKGTPPIQLKILKIGTKWIHAEYESTLVKFLKKNGFMEGVHQAGMFFAAEHEYDRAVMSIHGLSKPELNAERERYEKRLKGGIFTAIVGGRDCE